ncbi:LRR receptor-like serine/threonine-protein kinase efr [Phtheirospermum japonicum]|uniref:LRR receptor-like serine/threonine-protein kinase efr n=1 Tax=Phtheirospermum japonicum TaxID=374723 RepID=A0A830D5Y5_9LAMI|nr:LRR receptor-like serine/threonine-protein kinase efr [Phtheirospermum japonicum]
MENSCFIFSLVLLLLYSTNKPFSATTLDLTTDQNALVALKNTITWDPYGALDKNWSSNTSVCYWIGVSCGTKHQRVAALNISGFALRGTLPPHLGNLTFLRYLDISFNNFTGLIPYELSRLHRTLRLRNNTFSGKIPRPLFNNNSKLQTIDMGFNSLNGGISEEIANCSSLQILRLNYNQLTGPIPYGIFNLSSIREIRIMFNGLSGTLPSDMCNNLPNLTTLTLTGNQIEGQIPPNIWKCRELERLSLSINRFNGEIPSEIGGLSMLRHLYLGINDFKLGI